MVDGTSIAADDSISPAEFKRQFLEGDASVSGTKFEADEAQAFIDQVTAALGHEPSGQEILQLLIAKVQ